MEKFKELNKLQAERSITFSKNVREYKDELRVTLEQLKGLPQDFINRLERDDEGKYVLTLNYPDYNPFMQNAQDDEARKQLAFKYARRGGEENVKLLEEVLMLRAKTAKLLGYKNHASARLDTRMAKTPQNVMSFLTGLEKQLRPLGKAEEKELLKFKLEQSGIKSKQIQIWENAYWKTLHKKLNYNVDPELIKEYFQADYVIENMFKIFGGLFGVSFKTTNIPAWHKDVKTYAVIDDAKQETIAYIYMDLYPREGKYKHAACFDLVDGKELKDGSYQKPFTAIVANMNPPSKDTPSLLKHGEVETLFHEFGHVLHNVLTEAKYSSISGTAVSRDFVEVPSQIMENWAWSPVVLKQISKHYKTGQPLDDETIDKMIAAKNHMSGGFYLAQDFYAQIDMRLHTKNTKTDTTKMWGKYIKKITGIPMIKNTYPQASFDHFMGYDAGYYGYLWALVIAQDFFGEFEKNGIFDKATGMKFRKTILAPGGSYDEEKMVQTFLGRKVSNEPFLESIGLK
jgi:thimet oligopeptidase